MTLKMTGYESKIDLKWLDGKSKEKGYLGRVLPIINKPYMTIEEILLLSNTVDTKLTYVIDALKKSIGNGVVTMTIKEGNKNLFKGNFFTRIDVLLSISAKKIQNWWRLRKKKI